MNAQTRSVQPLADEHVVVLASADPSRIYTTSPGIVRLESGRLIATAGLRGPGLREEAGPTVEQNGKCAQGKIFTSDDGGETWQHRLDFAFRHARPFVCGQRLYVLGQADDLTIIRSDDAGETWSAPARLTDGQSWHQAPSNAHYANDCVYLVMERRTGFEVRAWYVSELAPVLMRGRIGDDLTRRENWTFAGELTFRDAVKAECLDWFGVPFLESADGKSTFPAPGRDMAPIGWLETNVVQFTDPDHIWHDPDGKTFYLWMRAHTGGTGYACIAKVIEQGGRPGTGEMVTQLEKVPSGRTVLYVPCPGGQMKFHVLCDEESRLFWLLSTQATDSMIRPERMPEDRYNLPNNERRRLQLHFSRNMIDWCFAGLVAAGPVERASRHYASMAVDGEDLVILSRSGDERARSAHDGNLITFHRVRDFRGLVY
jgi:hypothetical protein